MAKAKVVLSFAEMLQRNIDKHDAKVRANAELMRQVLAAAKQPSK